MLDKDLDAGENPKGLTTAPGNLPTATEDSKEKELEQTYIASRWQGDAPTYSVVEVDDNTFKLDTYRTDTDKKIDTFTIKKESKQESSNSGNTSGGSTTVTPGTPSGSGQTTTEKPSEQKPEEEVKPEEEKPAVPAKGSAVKDSKSGVTYKVTKSGAASGTVQFAKVSDKKAKSVTIPSTVKVDGISYKVTSVDANAFSGCKNLQKVVLGANITKVSANTFSKCSGLNTIVIKSTKLTSENLSKRAFKGISSKTVIKVPKNKVKTYQKLFVKKGLSKKVKIKAI